MRHSHLGLFVISSDELLAGDITLTTAEGAVSNSLAHTVLADGGLAYFLGLTADNVFSSATLGFVNDSAVNFVFNLDDITTDVATTAVPEPGTLVLVGVGLMGYRRYVGRRPGQTI